MSEQALEAEKDVSGIYDGMADGMNTWMREAIFKKRRETEAAEGPYTGGAGGGSSADLTAALGHWAEHDTVAAYDRFGDDRFIANYVGDDADVRMASHHIHNHYMVNNQAEFSKLGDKLKPEDTPLDLSSPDARLATLDNLTQNKAGNENAESTCAASSLVAAALLAGGKTGTEGLLTLMKAMEQNANENSLKSNAGDLEMLRKKIEKGEALTISDMHTLQRDLHSEMKSKENEEGRNKDNLGVDVDTMKGFLAGSPEMAKMMKDNELAVSYIDNNGGKKAFGHAVLQIGRGEGKDAAIYDPYLRDEGQLITSDRETADYKKAEMHHIG